MRQAECSLYSPYITFAEFRPTSYDQRGVGSDDDNADWLVVPVLFTRNIATLLEESNWAALQACLESADPTGEDYQHHSFGHWATPFELYIVRPDSAAYRAAQAFTDALADYPAADEEDFCRREYEQQHADISDGLRQLTIVGQDGDELDTDALVSDIWSHMWNDGQPWRCLEETGQAGGGGVDRDDCERALTEMGYTYCDEEYTWTASV